MQRYAHMRRSNVERAFQIHFDDCCYVCQPRLKGSRGEINTAAFKNTHTGCLLSRIDDEERGAQRCGCCGLKKTGTRRCSVSTFMEKLLRLDTEDLLYRDIRPRALRRLDRGAGSMVFSLISGYLRGRRSTELTTVRAVAATRSCAQEKGDKKQPGPNRQEVWRKKQKQNNQLTFQTNRPLLSNVRRSHGSKGEPIVSVYGRRSCRVLLHLSVPEGLQTLCTEFGGVAENAKWTRQPG